MRLFPNPAGEGALALVSWRPAVRALAAGRLPCSDSEGHLLRIAASIAEGVPVDLNACLSTLDNHNIELVADALLMANGCSGRGGSR